MSNPTEQQHSNDLAFLNRVADHLRVDAGFASVEVEYPGWISLPVTDKLYMAWGTANPTWDGDVYPSNDDCFDSANVLGSIITDCAVTEPDASAVALAITKAIHAHDFTQYAQQRGGRMIYFATISTYNTVHAGCLGFTHTLYAHVQADSEQQATALLTRHYAPKGAHIRNIALRPALQQDAERYTTLLQDEAVR